MRKDVFIKRVLALGIFFFFVSMTLTSSIIAVDLASQDYEPEITLKIRGGYGYRFSVSNPYDHVITAHFYITNLKGDWSHQAEFTVIPHMTKTIHWGILSAPNVLTAQLSCEEQTIQRTGFVVGPIVIFVTPPFF